MACGNVNGSPIPKQDIVPRASRLNEVIQIIDVNQKYRRENLQHFDTVWKQLCGELKKDLVFKELQNGYDFAGDYGDGIKINQSEEHDFHFYFCLPDSEKLRVIASGRGVEINIKNLLIGQPSSPLVNKKLQELSDTDFFLLPTKINTWVRKLMETYIKSSYSFTTGSNTFIVTRSKHGSGELLHINVNKDVHFEVNIYPSIKLQCKQHWISVTKLTDDTTFWTALTKKQKNAPRSFQCSYENIERGILSSVNQLRNALTLLMKIRNKDMLTTFKTEHLKAVCLLVVGETKLDSWRKIDTKTALVTVFSKWLQLIKEGRIPSFWESNATFLGQGFRNQLLSSLQPAYNKVVKNEIPWAFCNKEERLFYYGISKNLSYIRGHHRHFDFNNSHLSIDE